MACVWELSKSFCPTYVLAALRNLTDTSHMVPHPLPGAKDVHWSVSQAPDVQLALNIGGAVGRSQERQGTGTYLDANKGEVCNCFPSVPLE